MAPAIIQIRNAPLPTPDPWANDPEDHYRCPSCGLIDPGRPRCRRCKTTLVRRFRRRQAMTANLVNLCVILFGKGPLLLAIGFLYREPDGPWITPWTIWLTLQIPLLILAAALLAFRFRAGWYLALIMALIQLIAAIGLQLMLGGNPVLPVAAILASLMITGLLLNVYDEVRLDEALVDLPPEHRWPHLPADLYNLGASYSKQGLWYLAARFWQRTVALEHSEGRYRRALALAYAQLHEYAAARAELAAAQALLPDDPQVIALARVFERLPTTPPA
ncbi:MAG: hypothetical protein AB4911_16260 [Oscillochloridaceae bacterium umkhey_bin13]